MMTTADCGCSLTRLCERHWSERLRVVALKVEEMRRRSSPAAITTNR